MSEAYYPQPTPPPLPPTPRRKSPGVALLFSLLPGLGHIYLGLHQRGIAFFGAFLASLWLGEHAELSGAIIAFVFFYAMIDAYQLATGPTPTPSQGSPRKGNLVLGSVLIVAGALALYSNFYPLDFSFLADWWPLALIVLGLWMLVADLRTSRRQQGQELPSE